MPARELENVVVERIKYLSNSPDILQRMIKKAQDSSNTVLPDLSKELNSKTQLLVEIKTDIDNHTKCITKALRTEDDISVMLAAKKGLIKQQAELEHEIQVLRFKIEEIKNRITNVEIVQNNLKHFRGVFNNLDYNRKKELLNLIIKEIRWNGEKRELEIDLYQLPDIGPYIVNDSTGCTTRTNQLLKTHPSRTQTPSIPDSENPLKDNPFWMSELEMALGGIDKSYWLTDIFAYQFVKSEKGSKMYADWGYPPC